MAELFDIREIIGDGTYAEVRMCFERATGNKYALKVVDRSKYNGKVGDLSRIKFLWFRSTDSKLDSSAVHSCR